LATFCWTKLLLCKDAFQQEFHYSEVLPEDYAQFASQKIWFLFSRPGRRIIPSERPFVQSTSRLNDVSYHLDAHLTKASSVRTTRTSRPDLSLCREVLNYSSLHPSGRLLVFNKLKDFFPKYSYGKITATVQTTYIPVRTGSSIRQVS
jgi:hypothetical protein